MISCQLRQCGLGSQLFQIAATLALAWDNDDKAVFDFTRQVQPSQGHRAIEYVDSIYSKLNIAENIKTSSTHREVSMKYKPILYQPDLSLDGFFFSEKYFGHHRDKLLNLFAPPQHQYIDLVFRRALLSQGFSICAIHVRRGDYAKYSRYHPILDIEYYRNAMSLFPQKTRFIIFSDDIEWCKLHFIGEQYKFVENLDDVNSLYLMSMCQHQIIANSTFSWWGAWLNQNPNKLVTAPQLWYCGEFKSIDTKDLCPNWMIQL